MSKFCIGMAEPMMISSPYHKKRRNEATHSMTSLLDIVPTFLDWFKVSYPNHSSDSNHVNKFRLTGRSLIPLLIEGEFYNIVIILIVINITLFIIILFIIL